MYKRYRDRLASRQAGTSTQHLNAYCPSVLYCGLLMESVSAVMSHRRWRRARARSRSACHLKFPELSSIGGPHACMMNCPTERRRRRSIGRLSKRFKYTISCIRPSLIEHIWPNMPDAWYPNHMSSLRRPLNMIRLQLIIRKYLLMINAQLLR